MMQALGTRQGVLLFDGSGFDLQYMRTYLQYVADNYFTPHGQKLGCIDRYGLWSDDTLQQFAGRQHRMFSSLDGSFLPRKESYLDPGILHGHRLLESHPLKIDSKSFTAFTDRYGLSISNFNRNIVRLLEIREEGYMAGFADQREYPASLRSGFSEIDSALHRQIAHGVSQYGSINRSQLDTRARKEAERLLRDRYDIIPDSGDPGRMVCRQSAATKPMNKNRIKR